MKTIAAVLILSCVAFGQHIRASQADITNLNLPFSQTVESFGAVGDWNGSTGTDNTTAIQNCLNSFTAAAPGVCTLQNKAYKITGTLTISKSGVGLVGVDGFQPNTSLFTSSPTMSTLVSTSASADIIDISGVSTANSIYGNFVKNIALERTVVPTGTAKGLSLTFLYKEQISNVVSMDSIYNFYFKGVGSLGFGYVENNAATWGYNGVTETSGSVYGFYVDSSGGTFSPSLRLRNNFSSSILGAGVTTYGFANVGTLGADWHLLHDETAGVNYGIYLNNSGSGFIASADIQIVDPINDNCVTTCIFVTGLTGSVSITGGWLNPVGANAIAADFESGSSGSQVSLVNTTVFASGVTGATGVIIGHNSYNVQLIGNKIQSQTSSSNLVSFNGVTAGAIEGNTLWAVAATTTLINLVSTLNVPISNNVLNGTATNGIVLDSNTHGIPGLETDTCGASVATITNCLVDSGKNYGPIISHYCGTTTTCASLSANTNAVRLVTGTVALSGGTAVIGSISPAFTSTSTFWCIAQDTTTVANAANCVATSTSSATITGTGTDTVNYIMWGN